MSDVMTTKSVRLLRQRFERERDMAVRASVELVGRAKTDPAEDARLELALSEMDKAQARLAALPEIKVTREPDMYTPGGRHSFLRDLVAAGGQTGGPVDTDSARAAERLQQHGKYEQRKAEMRSLSARAALDYHGFRAISNGVVQARALSMAAGKAGEFSPPTWLDELFASVS